MYRFLSFHLLCVFSSKRWLACSFLNNYTLHICPWLSGSLSPGPHRAWFLRTYTRKFYNSGPHPDPLASRSFLSFYTRSLQAGRHPIFSITNANWYICFKAVWIPHSKSKDQPSKVANSARGQLNRESEYFHVVPVCG